MIRRSLTGLIVLAVALFAGPSLAAAQDDGGTDNDYETPVVEVDGGIADVVDTPRAAPVAAPAALPRTGSDIAVPLTVAGIAIALGAAAVLTSRRRNATSSL